MTYSSMSGVPEGLEPDVALLKAVESNNKEWVEAALATGANPHTLVPADHRLVARGSLLSLAAGLGHADVTEVLLDAGLDVDFGGEFGYTPLQVAVHMGHDNVVDVLLNTHHGKPDVNVKDKDGVSSLHLAARKDREYSAKALIAAGADLNARDNKDRTPLHVSVFGKSTRIMKLLLEAGTDPYALNDMGFSVLHIAALTGNERAVQELSMAGLKADDKDAMGLTPEEVAETWGSHSTAWLLRKMPKVSRVNKIPAISPRSQTMLRRSWEEYETEGEKTLVWVKKDLSYLLEANTPVNRDPHYQDSDGFTPMHWAAYLGLQTTAIALLNSCCSYPGAVNYDGHTPVDLAYHAGHTELAQELKEMISMKEDSSSTDLYWQLLVSISTQNDLRETMRLLCCGAPLQSTQDLYPNALVLAITCNKPRVVTLLAAAGAPLSVISNGLSLLQVAWLTPDVTMRVKVLVTRLFLNTLQAEQRRVCTEDFVLRDGIEHLLTNLKSTKPWQTSWPFRDKTYCDLTNLLMAAARNNCPLTATFLKMCGGMTFNHNSQGTTPLHSALAAKRLHMVKVMVRDLGACLYVADSQGILPLHLLPQDHRHQLEEEVYERERHQLENYRETAKDQETKKELEGIMQVFDSLFATYTRSVPHTLEEDSLAPALLLASRRGLQLFTYLVIEVGHLPINNVVDPTQESTALHQAASHGHSVCVALLLSLGACSHTHDLFGNTAAHLAAMFCHKLTYRMLRKHMGENSPQNRANRTHQDVGRNFKKYLKCYNKHNVTPEKSLRFNDPSMAIKELLTESQFHRKVRKLKHLVVDFSKGEAKEVKEQVLKEVGILVSEVAAQNNLYKGQLTLVGSSADGTRLFAPDEFDINVVVSDIENVQVEVEDLDAQEAVLKGHTLRARLKSQHPGLQGNAFKNNFYQLMKKCLGKRVPSDPRLSYVPPGLEATQAGVSLNFAWQGTTYPLLLVDVDVVPVLGVPWPARLKRPSLTPDSVTQVFLTNTEEGDWRFSLAGAEAEVLSALEWEDRMVYASCKLLLSYLKAERWMPKTVKAAYSWWDSRKWRITTPSGFGVKNSFLMQLEKKRAGELAWPKERLAAVASVLEGLCDNFKDPSTGHEFLVPIKIKAYFGGEFEKPKFGEGAPDIIKVLEENERTSG